MEKWLDILNKVAWTVVALIILVWVIAVNTPTQPKFVDYPSATSNGQPCSVVYPDGHFSLGSYSGGDCSIP
jgi:hypothetical protein